MTIEWKIEIRLTGDESPEEVYRSCSGYRLVLGADWSDRRLELRMPWGLDLRQFSRLRFSTGKRLVLKVGTGDRLDQVFAGRVHAVVKDGSDMLLLCRSRSYYFREERSASVSFTGKMRITDLLSGCGIEGSTCPSGIDYELTHWRSGGLTKQGVLDTLRYEHYFQIYETGGSDGDDGALEVFDVLDYRSEAPVMLGMGLRAPEHVGLLRTVTERSGLSWQSQRRPMGVRLIGTTEEGRTLVVVKEDEGFTGVPTTYARLRCMDRRDLEETAEMLLELGRYSGYRGKLTVFGWPLIERRSRVMLTEEGHGEGTYIVTSTTQSWLNGRLRQTLTLGQRTDFGADNGDH